MTRFCCPKCNHFLFALEAKRVTAGAEFALSVDVNCPRCKTSKDKAKRLFDVYVKGPDLTAEQKTIKKSIDG